MDTITINIPHKMVEQIIVDYVYEHYKDVLDLKDKSDISWNDYSLMTGKNGLEFTKLKL